MQSLLIFLCPFVKLFTFFLPRSNISNHWLPFSLTVWELFFSGLNRKEQDFTELDSIPLQLQHLLQTPSLIPKKCLQRNPYKEECWEIISHVCKNIQEKASGFISDESKHWAFSWKIRIRPTETEQGLWDAPYICRAMQGLTINVPASGLLSSTGKIVFHLLE